ncbi:DUF1565 domain-containing protein [Paenibacillus sp. 5J-6]|uniref:DUF1565 domain-containing protein n=1 Tax=Paenibacillus silvestris TaxID=2606219 RepID=A0A6L8V028_9BACL|nr:right-handed parallel beta-helix repeat-containing protein [Paenibacillus silvestris]MZQ82620.1 DUF1565 domain-containing protein [Paenibacillus silvestris]
MNVTKRREISYLSTTVITFMASFLILSLFVAAFSSLTVRAAGGNIYYVSTSGNDSNAGTLAAPWKTIQRAADVVTAGDTVYVRGGTYRELVTIKSSGSASGGYIQFLNYSGETPVIDGTGLNITSSNQSLFYISKVNYIRVSGFELANLVATSSSLDPAAIRVTNGSTNIQLLSNHIHDIKNTSSSGNAHGIHVLGNSATAITNLTINGNDIHDLVTGWSESLTLSGNIDGFEIARNKVHDNNNIGIELAGFYGACSSSCVDQTRNGRVAENTVYHIDSSKNPAYRTGVHAAGGIYADGATNIVIEKNHVYANDFGIELASEKAGKATSSIKVQNNWIHHNYGAGLIMGGSSSTRGGASNNQIVNNTFVENDTLVQGYGNIALQWNLVNNSLKNNIIYSQSQKTLISKKNTSGSANILDYNLYYTASGMNNGVWAWQGKTYTTWDSYQAASGNDAHSLFAEPRFVNKAANNFNLLADSPAIDKGLASAFASAADDYEGSARIQGVTIDIGADESTSASIPVNPVSSIAIDGNATDWAITPILSQSTSNATVLKANIENANLNLYAQWNGTMTKHQFYFNTDENVSTGFQNPNWSASGADYLLENGTLYRYSGTDGITWSWTKVANYKDTKAYIAINGILEVAIPLSNLAAVNSETIQVGYMLNDSKTDKLPLSGSLIPIGSNNQTEVTPAPTPTVITVNGDATDWSTVEELSSGSSKAKGMKAFHHTSNLYLLVQGSSLTSKSQIYINSDNNGTSGFAVKNWSSSGADFMVENGTLYRYSGNGSTWSWTKVTGFVSQTNYSANDTVIEIAIPQTLLGISVGSTVQLGFIWSDSASNQLPVAGSMSSYVLN